MLGDDGDEGAALLGVEAVVGLHAEPAVLVEGPHLLGAELVRPGRTAAPRTPSSGAPQPPTRTLWESSTIVYLPGSGKATWWMKTFSRPALLKSPNHCASTMSRVTSKPDQSPPRRTACPRPPPGPDRTARDPRAASSRRARLHLVDLGGELHLVTVDLVTSTLTPSSSSPAVSVQRIVVPTLPSRSPGQEMSSGAVPTWASSWSRSRPRARTGRRSASSRRSRRGRREPRRRRRD